MNRRATIALLLVAVLLAAFLALTRSGTLNIGGEAEEEENALPSFEPVFEEAQDDQAIAFSITDNQSGDHLSAVLNSEDATWEVTEAPSQPEAGQVVDAARLDIAANALTTLVVNQQIEEFESLALYGLETAHYTLSFSTLGGGEFKLDIGDTTPDGSFYYAQRPGENRVLVVGSATLNTFVDFLSEPPYAEPTPTFEPLPTP